MGELKITEKNFDDEVMMSDKPVLVDFWASWCGPCKMLSPVIKELADELGDKVKVGKINVDEEFGLAHTYSVTSIPTIILFENGEEKERLIGFHTKDEITEIL